MDGAPPTSVAAKRQSALPRFSSTKLPQPGLKSPTATTSIPAPKAARPVSTVKPPSSWNVAPTDLPKTSPTGYVGSAGSRPRTNSDRTANGHTSNFSRPASRQTAAVRPPSTSWGSENENNGIYGVRRGSVQDIDHRRNVSSEDSEAGSSAALSSVAGDISPVRSIKPRPSLSDRTIESLSKVPASPGGERRSSSFFGAAPPSPATPRRPASQMSGAYTAPKPGYSTVKKSNFTRPASPSKRPATSYGNGTPARRSVNSAVPKPPTALTTAGVPQSSTPQTNMRRASLIYPGGTTNPAARSGTTAAALRQARPQSQNVMSKIRPPSPTKARPASPAKIRPPSPTKAPPAPKQAPAPEPREVPAVESGAQSSSPSSSSAALRQQIAKAKAAARALASRDLAAQSSPATGEYDFQSVDDPFNQKPRDGKELLRKRIDDARRDGKLTVAAMGFKTIPEEVMKMYDSEAMESSTVSWSECVDLVRFNAADNDLTEIGDSIFPDTPMEELAADGVGNQFAGLETLDLHGNRLMKIPAGLRQLTRLTSLNLSRNNLDNLAVDVISQIATLRHLNLAHNSLSDEFPESIGKLGALETLDVSSNRLSQLPRTLKELLFLRTFTVSNNRLTNIPFEQLAVLPRLSEVSAASNALTGALFPSSVQTMASLRTLDVSDNAIASFNFSKVLNLPALVRIDVSRNRIGTFPDISQWYELTAVMADENALSAFPKGMTSLKEKLRSVSLERNSVREVDEAIADMTALERLNLAGNPIRERKLLAMDAAQVKLEMERKRQLSSDLAAAAGANGRA